jgi:hypothetical protein
LLSLDGSPSGLEVPPPLIADPFLSSFAEPDSERHRAPLQVVVKSAERRKLSFLNDIRSVYVGLNPTVQSQLDC